MASTDDNFENPVPDETVLSSDQDGVPFEEGSLGTDDVTLKSATLEKFRLELLEKERQLKANLAERDGVLLEKIQIAVEQLRITAEQENLRLKADQADKDRELEEIQLELKSLKFRNGNSDPPESNECSDSTWEKKVEEFAALTSMHGAPRIILNKNPGKRIVWFLIFIGCWAMFVYQTTLVVENYLTYPKKTSQEVVYDVPFPGFTICLNRKVSFYDAQKWLIGMNANSTIERKRFIDLLDNLNTISDFHVDLRIHPAYRSPEFNSFVDKSSISIEEAIVSLHGRLSNETYHRQFSKLIRLEEIPGGSFFKCFTVNPLDEYKYQIREVSVGVMDGTGMVPDTSAEKTEYIWQSYHQEGGYRVYVHPTGFKVDPDEEKRYFQVEPGHDVQISINAVEEFVRIGSPHGNCSDRNPYASTGSGGPEVAYQQDECVNQCWMKKLLERDNTLSMFLPPLGSIHCWFAVDRLRWCNYTTMVNGRPVNLTVQGRYSDKPPVDLSTCPCHRPCVEIEYSVSSTSESRPSRGMADSYAFFMEMNPIVLNGQQVVSNYSGRFRSGEFETTEKLWHLVNISGDDMKFEFIENYIQKDMFKAAADVSKLSLRMQMFNRKMERIVESPLYTSAQLVSEIGGQLGIWIGVSLITLTEVIELVIEICCKAIPGKKKEDKVDDNTRGADIIAV